MKRKLMDGKLIEIFEEITSTRNWVAPRGCKSVDVFVVGGGDNGKQGDWNTSGAGGRGGECRTYNAIPVTSSNLILISIGTANAASYFMSLSYQAAGAAGAQGGVSISPPLFTIQNGNPGYAGSYPFNNLYPSRFPRRYGAGGGSGGAVGGGMDSPTYKGYGGPGGDYGGGSGGNSYGNPESGNNPDLNGRNASFYGAGGGGGGKYGYYTSYSNGGTGYQGIVILHYWKYK